MDNSGEEAGARQVMRVILDVRVGGAAMVSHGSSAHARDRDTRHKAGSLLRSCSLNVRLVQNTEAST